MKVSSYKLFFRALSNETRIKIVELLKEEPMTVTKICKEANYEQSRVSHNLKCLKACGFVNSERDGRRKIYSLEKEITPILKRIDQHIEKYEERLKKCGIIEGKNRCEIIEGDK